jgi:hypothetical protein
MKASPRTSRQLNDLVCDLPNWRFARNDPACIQAHCREAAFRTPARVPILRQYSESRRDRFRSQWQLSVANGIRDVGRFATFPGRAPDAASAGGARRFQIERRGAGVPTLSINSIVSALRSQQLQIFSNATMSSDARPYFHESNRCHMLPLPKFSNPAINDNLTKEFRPAWLQLMRYRRFGKNPSTRSSGGTVRP